MYLICTLNIQSYMRKNNNNRAIIYNTEHNNNIKRLKLLYEHFESKYLQKYPGY